MLDRWIAIIGQGRGGTSPLYYAIVDALRKQGHPVLATYERYNRDVFANFARHGRNRWVITKFLTNHRGWDPLLVKDTPRRIQITRDPRDSAVSAMLFSAVHLARRSPEKRLNILQEWTSMLQRKEQNPRSIDFCDLYVFILKAMGKNPRDVWKKRWQAPITCFDAIDPFHVRLEDLVDNASVISNYLGFDIQLAPPPDGKQHVLRSGRSSWMNWFTPRDVEYFRPIMLPFMEKFGYADDWTLVESPVIEAAESSQYVQRTFQRIIDRQSALDDPVRRLAVHRYRADHGRVGDAYNVAKALVKAGQDLSEAREYAVFAASGGHDEAAALAARMFKQGIGGTVDLAESDYWRRVSGLTGGLWDRIHSYWQIPRRKT